MKPSLQFRLSQHLTLTPQLQQSIRLLQLSTVELNQEIERLLMENPALEREDHEDAEASAPPPPREAPAAGEAPATEAPAAPESDWSADLAANWRTGGDDEESDRSFSAPDTPTLRHHLLGQLTLTKLSERDRALVALLIDALDEDGYLTQPLEEIIALLTPETEIEPESLLGEPSTALRPLQNLEPAGVGARSPAECLCLQIHALKERETADPATCELALQIAEKHLELLAGRDYTRLKSLTGVGDDALRAAQRLILAL